MKNEFDAEFGEKKCVACKACNICSRPMPYIPTCAKGCDVYKKLVEDRANNTEASNGHYTKVIHCKECIFWIENACTDLYRPRALDDTINFCALFHVYSTEGDYCSWGKRDKYKPEYTVKIRRLERDFEKFKAQKRRTEIEKLREEVEELRKEVEESKGETK